MRGRLELFAPRIWGELIEGPYWGWMFHKGAAAPSPLLLSAYLGIDTTAGQLLAVRQLLLAQTSTPGTRCRGVRAAAHVSPTQVQNSSSLLSRI